MSMVPTAELLHLVYHAATVIPTPITRIIWLTDARKLQDGLRRTQRQARQCRTWQHS